MLRRCSTNNLSRATRRFIYFHPQLLDKEYCDPSPNHYQKPNHLPLSTAQVTSLMTISRAKLQQSDDLGLFAEIRRTFQISSPQPKLSYKISASNLSGYYSIHNKEYSILLCRWCSFFAASSSLTPSDLTRSTRTIGMLDLSSQHSFWVLIAGCWLVHNLQLAAGLNHAAYHLFQRIC